MMPLLISFFADAPKACTSTFLGLKPWFQYLSFTYIPATPTSPKECNVNLDLSQSANWNQLWLVGLVIVEDLLYIAGIAAVVFIIIGGIRYITSQGEPENTKAAQGTILNAIIGLAIALVSVGALNYIGNQLGGTDTSSGLPNIAANSDTLQAVFNIVFGIIGAISLLMIVLSGFKYVTANGDPGRTNSAKNTILYSLIGLGVTVLAFAIVNFLVVKLS